MRSCYGTGNERAIMGLRVPYLCAKITPKGVCDVMGFDRKTYIKEYNQTKTGRYTLRFQNDDKIYIALKKAAAENGVKETHYIKIAILNQLKEDGYIHKQADIHIRQQGESVTKYS